MAGAAQQGAGGGAALPKCLLTSELKGPSLWVQKKKRVMSFAALTGLESFPWPWIIPSDSEEVLSILQSEPS